MNHSIRACDPKFDCPCPLCGQGELLASRIAHEAEIKHDGRVHKLHISCLHVKQCSACGEVLFDSTSHDEISGALRKHLKLLSPQQIRDKLQSLGLMQKTFAERIRVAQETVSRWLSGAFIQSCAMDELMRMFFQREEKDREAQRPHEVVYAAGELIFWNEPQSYEDAGLPNNVIANPPDFIYAGTNVDIEMARGPPTAETPIATGDAERSPFKWRENGERHGKYNGSCGKATVAFGAICASGSVGAHHEHSSRSIVH